MSKKYKVFALVGPSGCGKDTILNKILKHYNKSGQFHRIVSYTSRPIRQGEKDGETYNYVTPDTFLEFFNDDKVVEVAEFNNWFYGTIFDSYDINKINIGIFDPTRLDILLSNKNIDATVFYITAKDNQRLIRQLSREDDPDVEEILRRYKTDNIDFADIYDIAENIITLKNNNMADLHSNILTILSYRTRTKYYN